MQLQAGQIEVLDDISAQILRAKTPFERLCIADGMVRFARELVGAFLRSQHPDWNEAAVQAEVVKRLSHGTD
ncbi:MAG: hypothetical protein WC956_06190 [bacterium]